MFKHKANRGQVLIFDSHPVQYKAPVYKELERFAPGAFEVVYATDVSVKGYRDEGFGREFAWDTPLLEGYNYRVLGNERGEPLSSQLSLTGRGILRILRERRPRAVLLTQIRYEFDFAAYLSALFLGIPIWIRQETQDEMFSASRSNWKARFRFLYYRMLYFPVQGAFCFGELNQEHLMRHGIARERIEMARFSVPDPLANYDFERLRARREAKRKEISVGSSEILVAFFGKFIPKKNPDLLLTAISLEPVGWKARTALLFVGAGEMESGLRKMANNLTKKGGPRSIFSGFINQKELPDFYLAADIVVLPSRRMGEAWGLVVNEALQAGCGVIITDAVGCCREFGNWERVRVIKEGDAIGLSSALEELIIYPRSFDWARNSMKAYSTEAAAAAIAGRLASQTKN